MANQLFKFGKIPNGLDLLNYFVGLTTFNWTAAASVAVSAISSRKQRKAAQGAAAAQAGAAGAATAEQKRQFDITQRQAEPFRQAGLQALEQQQALLGLGGPEAQQAAMQAFQESPGQAFLRQRGEQAILRGASATGGLGGARVQEALQQQGIGFAQQDLQNQLARLAGIAGQGQAVTQNIAGLGAQQAARIGQFQMQAGQAQAGGILGAAAPGARLMGQVGGALLSRGMAPQQTFTGTIG
jgi:hypothetical protein